MNDEERESLMTIVQSAAHIQRMAMHAAFQNGFSDEAVRNVRMCLADIEKDMLKTLRKRNGR